MDHDVNIFRKDPSMPDDRSGQITRVMPN